MRKIVSKMGKVRLGVVLSLAAAFVACGAIVGTTLFGSNGSNTPNNPVSDSTAEIIANAADATSIVGKEDKVYNLNGTHADKVDTWIEAMQYSQTNNKVVKVVLQEDWVAAPDVYYEESDTAHANPLNGINTTTFGTPGVRYDEAHTATNTYFYRGYLKVPEGAKVVLDLNGFKLDRNTAWNNCADWSGILWLEKSQLDLVDSVGTGKITNSYTVGNYNDSAAIVLYTAACNMYGGTICDVYCPPNKGTWTPGVMLWNSSTFNMYGGTIKHCLKGGVVGYYDCVINIYGGEFTENDYYKFGGAGGTLAASNGTVLNIKGGKFYNNYSAGNVAVFNFGVSGPATAVIENCEIYNNYSMTEVFRISYESDITFKNVKIYGNYGKNTGFGSHPNFKVTLSGDTQIYDNYIAPNISIQVSEDLKYSYDLGDKSTFEKFDLKLAAGQPAVTLAPDFCGSVAVQPSVADSALPQTLTSGWSDLSARTNPNAFDKNVNRYFHSNNPDYATAIVDGEVVINTSDALTKKEYITNPAAASQKYYDGTLQVIMTGYNPDIMEYTVNEAPEGATVEGRNGGIFADLIGDYEVEFTLTNPDEYVWVRPVNDVSGNPSAVAPAVTTKILTPKVGTIIWPANVEKSYTGRFEKPTLSTALYETGPAMTDINAFTYSPCDENGVDLAGGGVSAGMHYVRVDLTGGYEWNDGMATPTIENGRIKQYEIKFATLKRVVWADTNGNAVAAGGEVSYVYDSKQHYPIVHHLVDVNNINIYVEASALKYVVSTGGINAGTHTVEVQSVDNNSLKMNDVIAQADRSFNYTITGLPMTSSDVVVTVVSTSHVYAGVTDEAPTTGKTVGCVVQVKYKGEILESSLFTQSYTNAGQASTDTVKAKVTVSGNNPKDNDNNVIGNITGSVDKEYTIDKFDIKDATFVQTNLAGTATVLTYDGTAQTLTVGADVTKNNFLLRTGTYNKTEGEGDSATTTSHNIVLTNADFEIVSYSDNINASTTTSKAKVTIKGKGDNVTGEHEFEFTISRLELSSDVVVFTQVVDPDKIELTSAGNAIKKGEFSYTGAGITPSVVIQSADTSLYDYLFHGSILNLSNISAPGTSGYSKILVLVTPDVEDGEGNVTAGTSKDFKLEYVNNVNVGSTATIKLEGREDGNYSGSITTTFTIGKADISALSFAPAKDHYYYTGVEVKPTIKVTTAGITTNDADFTLTYENNVAVKDYEPGVNEGTAPKIEIKANASLGNYTGTATIYFSIEKAIIKGVTLRGMTVDATSGAQSRVFDNAGHAPVASEVSFGEHVVDSSALPEDIAELFSYELRKSDGTVLGSYDSALTGVNLDNMAKVVGDYYVVLTLTSRYSGNFEFASELITDGAAKVAFKIETAEFNVSWAGDNRNITYGYTGVTHYLNETAELKNVSDAEKATAKWYFKETKDGAKWEEQVPFIKDVGTIQYYYKVEIANYAEYGGEDAAYLVKIEVEAVDIEKTAEGAQLFALDLYIGTEANPEYIANGTAYTGNQITPKAKLYHIYQYAAEKTSGMGDYATIEDLIKNGKPNEKAKALIPEDKYVITYDSNTAGVKDADLGSGNYAKAIITPISDWNYTGKIEQAFEIIPATVQDGYLLGVKGYGGSYDGQEHAVLSGYATVKFPLSDDVTFYFSEDAGVKATADGATTWKEESDLWKTAVPKVKDVTRDGSDLAKKTVYVKIVATGYKTYYAEYEYEVTPLELQDNHVSNYAGERYKGVKIEPDEEFKVTITTADGKILRPVQDADYVISYKYYAYKVVDGEVVKDAEGNLVYESENIADGVSEKFFVGGKGVAKITAVAGGNYSGEVPKEFGIWGASEASATVTVNTGLKYDGTAQNLIANRATSYTNGADGNKGDPTKPDVATETVGDVTTNYRATWYWKVTTEPIKVSGAELSGAALKEYLKKEPYNKGENGWIGSKTAPYPQATGTNAGTYYVYYAVDIEAQPGTAWTTIASDFGMVSASIGKMQVYVDDAVVFDPGAGAGAVKSGVKVTAKDYDGTKTMPKANIDLSKVVFKNAETDAEVANAKDGKLTISDFASATLNSANVKEDSNTLTIRGLVLGGTDVDNYEFSDDTVTIGWNRSQVFIKAIAMEAKWYTAVDGGAWTETMSVTVLSGSAEVSVMLAISNPKTEADAGITLTPVFGAADGITLKEGSDDTIVVTKNGVVVTVDSTATGNEDGNYNVMPSNSLYISGKARRVYPEKKTYQYDGQEKKPLVYTTKTVVEDLQEVQKKEYLGEVFDGARSGYTIESIEHVYEGITTTSEKGSLVYPKAVGKYKITVSVHKDAFFYRENDGAADEQTFDVEIEITQARVTGDESAVKDADGGVTNVGGKFTYGYTGTNHNITLDWSELYIGSGATAQAIGTQPADISVEYRWSKDGGAFVGSTVGMMDAGEYTVEIVLKSETSNYVKTVAGSNEILKLTVTVEITRQRIDVSGVTFIDGEGEKGASFSYPYGGGVKSLAWAIAGDAEQKLPEGLTVKKIEYFKGTESQGTIGVGQIGDYVARMYFGFGENYALYRGNVALGVDYIEATLSITNNVVDLSGIVLKMPTADTETGNVVYSGSAYTVTATGIADNAAIASVEYSYAKDSVSNGTGAVDAGAYTVTITLNLAANYRANDADGGAYLPKVEDSTGVVVSRKIKAGNVEIVAGFTVDKAPLTVTVGDVKVEYGETAANNGVEFDGLVGTDEANKANLFTWQYEYKDNTGATYKPGTPVSKSGGTANIYFTLDSANYAIEIYAGVLTIEPREISVTWYRDSSKVIPSSGATVPFEYEYIKGTAQGPYAAAGNVYNKEKVELTVEGKEEGISTGYTATAKLPTEPSSIYANYKLSIFNTEQAFSIMPKTGDPANVNKIVWGSLELAYTGKPQVPEAGYLASTSATSLTPITTIVVTQVKVGDAWVSANSAVNVGKYKAKVVTSGIQFTEDSETVVEFEIVKAKVLVWIKDVTANYGDSYELGWDYYDNDKQFATLADANGVKLSVIAIAEGEDVTAKGKHAIEGKYEGNENYEVEFYGGWYAADTLTYNDRYGTLKIEQGELSATPTWGNLTFTYDGGEKEVEVNGVPKGVTYKVTYEKDGKTYDKVKNAGEYVASVKFDLGALAGNYAELSLNDATVTIKKRALTITAGNVTIAYGDEMSYSTVSYKGFVDGEDESNASHEGNLVQTSAYKAGDKVSTYKITLDEASTIKYANYEVTYEPGSMTVEKRGLTIKWYEDWTLTNSATEGENLVYGYKAGTTIKPYAHVLSGLYGTDTLIYVARREVVEVSEGKYETYYYDVNGNKISDAVMTTGTAYVYVTGGQTKVGLNNTATATINVIGDGLESNYYVKVGETQKFDVISTTVGEIQWSNEALTYDGTEKCPEAYYYDGTGLKPLTVTGKGTAAGDYVASVDSSLDLTGEWTKPYTIAPKAITVVIDGSGIDLKYGEDIDLSEATVSLKAGSAVADVDAATDLAELLGVEYDTVAKKGSDVGDYAITLKKTTNENYAVTYEAGTLSIKQAEIEGDVKWKLNGDETEYAPNATISKEYTGETRVLTISALPEGVTGVSYEYKDGAGAEYNGGVKNCATYTVTATFEVDGNHKEYEAVSVTLKITEKTATGLSFPTGEEATAVYDGARHGLNLVGSAEGVEKVNYNYYLKKSGGGKEYITPAGTEPKDAGEYGVEVTFEMSANYNAPTIADGTLTIEKATIKVVLKDAHVEYGKLPTVPTDSEGYELKGLVAGDNIVVALSGYAYENEDGEAYAIGSKVGAYAIKNALTGLYESDGVTAAKNYKLEGSEVVDGKLTVTPKELSVKWKKDGAEITEATPVYVTDNSAEAVGPEAELVGVVGSDDVTPVVAGNEKSTAGTYTAKVTGLDGDKAGNYTLNKTGASKDYEVKVDPPAEYDIVWDTKDHVYDGAAYKPGAYYYYYKEGATDPTKVTVDPAYVRGEHTEYGTYTNLALVDGYEKVAEGVKYVPGVDGVNNYFTNTTGTYSIVKRPITIVIDDVTIDYGDTVTTSLIGRHYEENSLKIIGDDVKLSFTTEATNSSGVGEYKIIGSYSGPKANNYDVTFKGSWIDEDGKYNGKCGTWKIETASLDISQVGYVGLTGVTYDGKAHEVTLSGIPEALNGKYSVKYVSDKGVEVTAPVNAGTYTLTFTFEDVEGFKSVAPLENVKMTIAKAGLTVRANDARTVYGEDRVNAGVSYEGFVTGDTEKVLGGDLEYAYTYTRGNASVTEIDEAAGKSAYLITPSGLTSDNYVITFLPGKLYVDKRPVTITWRYDTSPDSSTDLTYTFDTSKHAPYAIAGNLVTGDSVKVIVKVGDNLDLDGAIYGIGIKAGAVGLSGDSSDNYKLPDTGVETTYNIKPAKPYSVVWTASTYYYNGTATKPVATYNDENGKEYTVNPDWIHIRENNGSLETNTDVFGESNPLKATSSYVAYIDYREFTNFNNGAGLTGERMYAFTVQPAAVEVELTLKNAEAFKFVYGDAVVLDEENITATVVSGDAALIGDDVKGALKLEFATIAGTAGHTDVGLYDITATSGNGNFAVTVKAAQLEIVKKEVDVSGVEFVADWAPGSNASDSFVVEFRNAEYTVKVETPLPEGVESVSYEYKNAETNETYENGVKAVGNYEVTATFTIGGNYAFKNEKDSVSCEIEIYKKAVAGEGIGLKALTSVVYNGAEQKVFVTGADSAEGIESVSYEYYADDYVVAGAAEIPDGVTPMSGYPVAKGTYTVVAKFKSMANYADYADKAALLKITPRALTVTPNVKSVKYGTAIGDWAYTVNGLATGDSKADVIGKITYKVTDPNETDSEKKDVTAKAQAGTLAAGKYDVEITGWTAESNANYTVKTESTTLTVMNYGITAGEIDWYNDDGKTLQTLVYDQLDTPAPYAEALLTIDGKKVRIVFVVAVEGDDAVIKGIDSITNETDGTEYAEEYFALADGISHGIVIIPALIEKEDGEISHWIANWSGSEEYVYNNQVQTPEITAIVGVIDNATPNIDWSTVVKDSSTIKADGAGGFTIEAEVDVTYTQTIITVTCGDSPSATSDTRTTQTKGRSRRLFVCDALGIIDQTNKGTVISEEIDSVKTEFLGIPSATIKAEYTYYTTKVVKKTEEVKDEDGNTVYVKDEDGNETDVAETVTVESLEKDVELPGAPKDAGTYIIEVAFKYEGGGVDYGTKFVHEYTIGKRTVYTQVKDMTVTYGDSLNQNDGAYSYVYDVDRAKFVSGDTVGVGYKFEYADDNGNTVKPVNAGVYENAIHMQLTGASRNNYELKETSGTLTIEKAELSLGNLSINTDSVVYDGAKHKIQLGNLPNGVTASVTYVSRETGWSYTDGVTDAGVYDVTISFRLSDNAAKNFTTSGNLVTTFEIEKAPLTITANGNKITYGEAPVAAGVKYQGFVGGDTVAVLNGQLSYSYGYTQGGAVGNYLITPKGYSAANYAIEFVSGTLEVEKRVITIRWYADKTMTSDPTQPIVYNYDGNTFKPYAVAENLYSTDTVTLTVSGGQREPGLKYSATVTAINGVNGLNYALPQVTSKTFDVIPPAYQIVWDNTEFTYSNEKHVPGAYYYDHKGDRYELNVDITFSSVQYEGGAMDLRGINAGTYIATAKVPNNLVHPVTGEKITLTGDATKAYVINRIKVVIEIADVTVIYGEENTYDPNGWSYAEGSGRFIGDAPIELECTKAYDGEAKPTASIGAGSWAIEAVCNDNKNYDVTFVGSWSEGVQLKGHAGTFTVEKKVIAVPEIEEVEYNGELKIPAILQGVSANGDGVYTVTSDGKAIYTVKPSVSFDEKVRENQLTISLADTANYAWEGETNTMLVRYFVVKKATNEWQPEKEYQSVTIAMEAQELPKQNPEAKYGEVKIGYYKTSECLYTEKVTEQEILDCDVKGTVFYVLVEVEGTNEYTGLRGVYTITKSGTAALTVNWEGNADEGGAIKVEFTNEETLPKAYVKVLQPDGKTEKVYVEVMSVEGDAKSCGTTQIAGVKTHPETVYDQDTGVYETTYYLIATSEYAKDYNKETSSSGVEHMAYCVYSVELGEDPNTDLSQVEYEIVPMKLTINVTTISAGVYANADGLSDADTVTSLEVKQDTIPGFTNVNKTNLIDKFGLTFVPQAETTDYDGRGHLNAGKYALVITATSKFSNNFNITFVGDWAGDDEYAGKAGTYEVEYAKIELDENEFDIDVERNEKITIGFGTNDTINLTDVLSLAGGTPNSALKIDYINEAYTSGDRFCIDDAERIETLFRNQWQSNLPSMARSATYCVYYRMTVANHETKYGYFKIEVLVNGQAIRVYFNSETITKIYGDAIDRLNVKTDEDGKVTSYDEAKDGNLINLLIEVSEDGLNYTSKYIRELDASVINSGLTGHPSTESAEWRSQHLKTLYTYANAYAVDAKGEKLTKTSAAGTYAIAFEFNDAASGLDTEYVVFAYRGSSADEETNKKFIVEKRVLETSAADEFTYTGDIQIPDVRFKNLYDSEEDLIYTKTLRDLLGEDLAPTEKIRLNTNYEVTLLDGEKLTLRYEALKGSDNISVTAPQSQMVRIILTSDNYDVDFDILYYVINAHNLNYTWEDLTGSIVGFTYDGTEKLPVLVITDGADDNRVTRVDFSDSEFEPDEDGNIKITLASGKEFNVAIGNASLDGAAVEAVGFKTFTVTIAEEYQNGYRFIQGNMNVSYITASVQIKARELAAEFGSTELYYTGEKQAPAFTLTYGEGEGESVEVKITDADITAGKKIVELTKDMSVTINIAVTGDAADISTTDYRVTLSVADTNYALGTAFADYSISENELTIDWSGIGGTYDGSSQKPIAKVTDKYGNSYEIDFGAIDFKETIDDDGNTIYVAKDFVIEDLSGVEVVVDIVYEGTKDGVTAGDYKATITPKDPSYAVDKSGVYEYEIEKAEVTAKWYYHGDEWNGEPIEVRYESGKNYADDIQIEYNGTRYTLSQIADTTLTFDNQQFVIPDDLVNTAGKHEIVLGNDNYQLKGGAIIINVAAYELDVTVGNSEFYYMGNVVTAPKITIKDTREDGAEIAADLGEALAALNGGAKTATATIEMANGDKVELTLSTSANDLHTGNYTLEISSANGNYKLTGANDNGEGVMEINVRIARRTVTLNWRNADFVYDGTAKLPVISLSYDTRNDNGGIEAATTEVVLEDRDVLSGSKEITLEDGAVIVIGFTATKNGTATTTLSENYLLRARVSDTGYSLVNANGNTTVETDVVVAARQLKIDLLDENGNAFNPQYTGDLLVPVIRVTDLSDGSFVDVTLSETQIQQLIDTDATTFSAAFANGYSVQIAMSFSNGNNLIGDKSSGGNQVFRFNPVEGLVDISGATDFTIRGNGFTLGAGAIVGIVLGAVALVAAIVVLIILLKRRSAMQGEFIDEQGFDDEYDDDE